MTLLSVPSSKVVYVFRTFDIDASGTLTLDEFQQMVTILRQKSAVCGELPLFIS
jgi:Ca2+-binding EF-hand superfamily protein